MCCGRVRRLWRARRINSHTQEHNIGSNDAFGTQRDIRDWSLQQIASVNNLKSKDLRFAFSKDLKFKPIFKISVVPDGITLLFCFYYRRVCYVQISFCANTLYKLNYLHLDPLGGPGRSRSAYPPPSQPFSARNCRKEN